MATVAEQIRQAFPQVREMPNLIEDAVEHLIEHAVECDEAGGSGWNQLSLVVNGQVPLAMLREAVELMMTREAGHMLDAMRGVIAGKLLEELDEDDVTHYFRIRDAYNGLSNAGLI